MQNSSTFVPSTTSGTLNGNMLTNYQTQQQQAQGQQNDANPDGVNDNSAKYTCRFDI